MCNDTDRVLVAHLSPSLGLIHNPGVDPPAVSTTEMTRSQAELLGYEYCPDCRGGGADE